MREVQFYDDKLLAEQDDKGQVWVPIKPICEALGMDYTAQWRRVKRNSWAVVALMAATGKDGKSYEMFCLHIDSVPMWLATVQAGRVAPEVRPVLAKFQKEAAAVLARAFIQDGEVKQDTALSELTDSLNRRLDEMGQKLDRAVSQTDEIGRLIKTVVPDRREATIGLLRHIMVGKEDS